jgi:hypothetical protein
MDDLPDPERNLLLLMMSLVLVSFPVEVWSQPRVPDSGAAYLDLVVEPKVRPERPRRSLWPGGSVRLEAGAQGVAGGEPLGVGDRVDVAVPDGAVGHDPVIAEDSLALGSQPLDGPL